MSEQERSAVSDPPWASFEAIEEAGKAGRAYRVAQGEIMTYVVDGWVVREYPGGRVKRLATVGEFRSADFPYPG